jgi:FAD synthetase
MQTRAPTDPGWPPMLRVNALLEFDYAQVWQLLRQLYLPYCSVREKLLRAQRIHKCVSFQLYDTGYTSLGCAGTTHPNDRLKYVDAFGRTRYRAAHTLEDVTSEREGRV